MIVDSVDTSQTTAVPDIRRSERLQGQVGDNQRPTYNAVNPNRKRPRSRKKEKKISVDTVSYGPERSPSLLFKRPLYLDVVRKILVCNKFCYISQISHVHRSLISEIFVQHHQ